MWIPPHAITLTALCFGVLALPLLIIGNNWTAIACLLISGYLDMLDGSIARLQQRQSDFGAVLDITCDRIVEWSVIMGLFLMAPLYRALPCLLMLGSVLICITSFLVVAIVSENASEKSFRYSPGLIERAEAFVLWILMILFPTQFSLLAYLFSILVLFTAASRLWQLFQQRGSHVKRAHL